MSKVLPTEIRARKYAGNVLAKTMKPPSRMRVSEWADKYRILPETSAMPGPWRTNRTPYLRKLMDCASDPRIRRLTLIKPAQIGFSEMLLNVMGYFMDQDPTTILMVQISSGEAKKFSKERVQPMIETVPTIAARMGTTRSGKRDDTMESKRFTGGHLGIVGANAPSQLRSRARRILLNDEIDGYPASAGEEGDPRDLARKRQTTYGDRAFEMQGSTPTIKDLSNVEADVDASDEVWEYWVPCPHCHKHQRLAWERIEWPKRKADGEPLSGEVEHGDEYHSVEDAKYRCAHCEKLIDESRKLWMIRDEEAGGTAEWRAEIPHPSPRTIGVRFNGLYSPFLRWATVAREFLESLGNREKLQVWVNTRLGETWDEGGTSINPNALLERLEDYESDPLPKGVLLITAGVDVQADRLEMEIVGWGKDGESWSLEYFRIDGDPSGRRVWQDLDRVLMRRWKHPLGPTLRIGATCIDSGYMTQVVMSYAKDRREFKVWAVKGIPGFGKPIMGRPASNTRSRVPLYPVGVDTGKTTVYAHLSLEKDDDWDGESPLPGYWHFPNRQPYDEVFFRQMTAEKVKTVQTPGNRPKRVWVVKAGRRSEVLDCRNYALAAREGLIMSGVRFDVLREQIEGNIQPRRRGVRRKAE